MRHKSSSLIDGSNHKYIKSCLFINTTAAHPLHHILLPVRIQYIASTHTVALTQFIRSSLVTTVKVLYKRIFLRSDNDQKHDIKSCLSVVEATLFLGASFNQTTPGPTVLLSSLRSLKQCSRNIQLLRSSPNKTTYLQHILKRHSHQSCIDFRSRYKTEQANLRILSEKKDLLTRGSRLCRIWIGIQHLQENFSCSLLPSKVRLHARKSPGYCVSHLDVQGRKCVNVRKRILSAKYHY